MPEICASVLPVSFPAETGLSWKNGEFSFSERALLLSEGGFGGFGLLLFCSIF